MVEMRRPYRLAALFAALFLAALGAFADSEGIRVLYVSEGGLGPIWSESLAAALARSELLDAVLPAPEGMEAGEAAARLSCALAVRVSSRLSETGEAASDWSVIDPLTREILAKGRIEGPSPTDRELAVYWWLSVVQAAEAALPKVKRTLVRVRAAPGTVVTGLGEDPVTMPAEGFLDLPLRVPGTYPWRAVSPGAYPERGYFGALEQGQTLSIPRTPLRPWSLEAGLVMMEFPDIWAERRFKEDMLFLRFGLAQYLFGLHLTDEEYGEATPPVIVSLPLVMPGVGIGRYLSPPDATIRPYVSATAFARFIFLDGYWGFDPIAPAGVLGSFGFDWKAVGRTSIYFELGTNFYPFCDGYLLASTRGEDSGGPFGVIYSDWWLLEFPILRLGARVSL